MVLIKLRNRNALNNVRRDHIPEVCATRASLLLRLAISAYSKPGKLLFGYDVVMSETGMQQIDGLGPVLFARSIDNDARSVTSTINVWYLADATIGGSTSSVRYYPAHIIPALSRIGLDIDLSRCEVISHQLRL